MQIETTEQHRARLKARHSELCRELARTDLTITTLEQWASLMNERVAVSQMLFRLDLLMTAGVVEVASVVINENEEQEDPLGDWSEEEPEWLALLRPQPEPQPVPEWLQLFPAPNDVLTQWAGEEARP